MGTGLFDALGYDSSDPTVVAAQEDARSFGRLMDTLVGLRTAQHLTQTDVARVMGTTQSSVSDLERAGSDPRFSTLQRYARAVGAKLRCSVPLESHSSSSIPVFFASTDEVASSRDVAEWGSQQLRLDLPAALHG